MHRSRGTPHALVRDLLYRRVIKFTRVGIDAYAFRACVAYAIYITRYDLLVALISKRGAIRRNITRNLVSLLSPQFHTCVITENVVSFPRSELDVACDDPRCPSDSVVTLYFATDAKRQNGPVPAPTPAVPHASAHHDPVLHWDSYTNLEISDDGECALLLSLINVYY